MRSLAWTAMVATVALATSIGCSSETESGTGGSGATGGSTNTGTAHGGQGGVDPTCHGDQTAWDGIEKTHIACVVSSDCCVVVNPCTAESQVVHADDFSLAPTVWPYCDDECVFCIPEYVDIACVAGECVASPPAAGGEPLEGVSQCGVDDTTPDLPNPGLVFGCQ